MTTPLPDAISELISGRIEPFSIAELRETAQSLSTGYRSRENMRSTLSPLGVAAYLGARFPSTYAVAHHVWRSIASDVLNADVETVLDVGAGPGTASWAALDLLPAARFTLLERDASWRDAASSFATTLGAQMTFAQGAFDAPGPLAEHDAVVACYALNELPESRRGACIERLWRAARRMLIVIEPGTPLGFGVIRDVRDRVLANGGSVMAPCTHNLACPMTASDWCHFPLRVQRPAIQRNLKQAELGYEDEKFSYVVLSREPVTLANAGRIIRKPIRAKGHLHLDTCERGLIVRHTLSKKQGNLYRDAKDADWGDVWPL